MDSDSAGIVTVQPPMESPLFSLRVVAAIMRLCEIPESQIMRACQLTLQSAGDVEIAGEIIAARNHAA